MFIPYKRPLWEGDYFNKGNTQDYITEAVMTNDRATAFVNYWNNTLSKTVTAECTCVQSYLSAAYQLVTITEPGVTVTDADHEQVIDDIDTTETALIAMSTTIATENADAKTYADLSDIHYEKEAA